MVDGYELYLASKKIKKNKKNCDLGYFKISKRKKNWSNRIT